MTSKLKCPFCGEETIALSDKLKIARKALEEIDWCAQDYAKAQEALEQIEHKDNK